MAVNSDPEKNRDVQFQASAEIPFGVDINSNDLRKGTDRDDLDMQRIGKKQQLNVR